MKKRLLISILTLCFLAGCGQTESQNSNIEQVQTTDPEDEVICDLIDEFETFSTEAEFHNSAAYERLKGSGIEIYQLQYDTERYSLSQINTNVCFYTYCMYDNINNTAVNIEILFDPTISSVTELLTIFDNESGVIRTAEKDGTEYDIYLSSPRYNEELNYSMIYTPFENYRVSIHAKKKQTTDEILEYFDDFELVEVQEE